MTTEAVRADLRARPAYVAVPPSECLNGCQTRQSSQPSPVYCEPGNLLCPKCIDRADTWLRQIPDYYALLPAVVDHGTVATDPGTKHTKRPDPPAPMRLEVVDLLDERTARGVLGIVHPWADVLRDERRLAHRCRCGHPRPTHTGRCSAEGCGCTSFGYTVAGECVLLLAHLGHAAQQHWVNDLYDELKQLHRALSDTVGEYRPKPVGKCSALVDLPETGTAYSIQQGVCGGALVMDRAGVGVHCLGCGARYEATLELRQLGLAVDQMLGGAA